MPATGTTLLAMAGLAAAQSATPTVSAATTSSTAVSGCGNAVDLIINNCLDSQTLQLKACAANDWDCLCNQSNNVLTCYNNCPSDPNMFGAQQTKVSYCNAAKAYPSSSSSASQTATGTASSSSAAAAIASTSSAADTSVASGFATATSSGSADATGSSASSASAASSSSGASAQYAPAGLAAFFGLVALL